MMKEDKDEIVELLQNKGSEDDQTARSILVGKLWTNKRFNTKAFMVTIKRVWNTKKGVEITEFEKKPFLISIFIKKG